MTKNSYLPKNKILELLYKELVRCENELFKGFDLTDINDYHKLIHYTAIMDLINDIEGFYQK